MALFGRISERESMEEYRKKQEEINKYKVWISNEITGMKKIGAHKRFPSSWDSWEQATHAPESKRFDINRLFNYAMQYNEELTEIAPSEDRRTEISVAKDQAEAGVDIFQKGLLTFIESVCAFPLSRMMLSNSYGKIDMDYWTAASNMERKDAVEYIAWCQKAVEYVPWEDIDFDKETLRSTDWKDIDLEKVLCCLWFFATEKTFSAADFSRTEALFCNLYKRTHADVLLAKYYSQLKLAGEDALVETIQKWTSVEENDYTYRPNRFYLKNVSEAEILPAIASGLMWMKAYQSERMVLHYMMKHGIPMSAKAQERLQALTNGGGKVPESHDVKAKQGEIYVDISALAWQKEDFVGLFDSLAFQDTSLSYALAVREENKNLLVDKSVFMPTNSDLLTGIKASFAEEYDASVSAAAVKCIALSGADEERMDCILVSTKDCKQLGILIYITKIGKKLIIKFYTLFTPTGTDIAAQKTAGLVYVQKAEPLRNYVGGQSEGYCAYGHSAASEPAKLHCEDDDRRNHGVLTSQALHSGD